MAVTEGLRLALRVDATAAHLCSRLTGKDMPETQAYPPRVRLFLGWQEPSRRKPRMDQSPPPGRVGRCACSRRRVARGRPVGLPRIWNTERIRGCCFGESGSIEDCCIPPSVSALGPAKSPGEPRQRTGDPKLGCALE